MKFTKQLGVSYVIFLCLVGGWFAVSLSNYTPRPSLKVGELPPELAISEEVALKPQTEQQTPAPTAELALADLIRQNAKTPEQVWAIEQAVAGLQAMAQADLEDGEHLQAAVMELLAGVACLKHQFVYEDGGSAVVTQVPAILMQDKAFEAKVNASFSAWKQRQAELGDEALLSPEGSGCQKS